MRYRVTKHHDTAAAHNAESVATEPEHPAVKKYKRHTRRTRIVLLSAYFVAGAGLIVAVWAILTAVNYSNSLSNDSINQPNLVGVVLPLPSNRIGNIKDVTWKSGAKDAVIKSSVTKSLTLKLASGTVDAAKFYTTDETLTGDFDYLVDWKADSWCQALTCEIPVGVATTNGEKDERVTTGITNNPVLAFATREYVDGQVQPATFAESVSPNGSVLIARRGNQIITYYVNDGTYTYLAKRAVTGECCKLLFGVRNQSSGSPLAVTFTKFEVRQ